MPRKFARHPLASSLREFVEDDRVLKGLTPRPVEETPADTPASTPAPLPSAASARLMLPHPAPIILVDTREQTPLYFIQYPTRVDTLPVGDYGIEGFSSWTRPAFIIERKSLPDLCGSLGQDRERFMKEVEKLRQFAFRALVIEATRADVVAGNYRSSIAPASILGTLDAICVRCGIHVFWCGGAEGAARQVESLVEKFVNGISNDFRSLIKNSVIQ